MWRWIAGAAAVAVLVIVQMRLDLVRVAQVELQDKLSHVHLPSFMNNATTTLSLTSSAFSDGGMIPGTYTCDGAQPNPPLAISGVPQSAQSLALVMDDPDVPVQVRADGMFDHWVVFNMPATTTAIAEGEAPPGVQGKNGAGGNAYVGPCPPKQYYPSEHRYFFTLYALDTMLELPASSSKAEVQQAMQGHIIAKAQLMGRYQRP